MLLFGFLAILLLVGVILRAKVSFFQRFLFPSCLIGGLLGLIAVNTHLIDFAPNTLDKIQFLL